MRKFSHIFLLAWGWQRWGLAFVFGAIAALAFPPFGWFPILFLSLPALVWLLDGAMERDAIGRRRFRPALAVGWWFGFGFHLAGLWWIGTAFLVDAEAHAWLMPFAVIAMPAGLALFTALATGVARLVWHDGVLRILALALVLSAADWLRGHVLTGFPWNVWGYALSGSLPMIQFASVVGVYGLGFLVTFAFAAPAVIADAPGRSRTLMLAASPAILLGLALFGYVRLQNAPPSDLPDTIVRVVQPSIPQAEKWLPERRAAIFADYVDLSAQDVENGMNPAAGRIVVWPEAALPFLLTEEPGALAAIAALLRPQDILITGAVRVDRGSIEPVYYNSVYVVAEDGTIVEAYDKTHLVPFGEYVPLEGLLEKAGIAKLVQGAGDFGAGFRHRVLQVPGLPSFLPLICYEAIFPGAIVTPDGRPELLLNVTNDAWFGTTSGPFQHFAQARMRSVEQGLPMVRAANTGISAIIDPYGRVRSRIGLNKRDVIDATLPGALPPTIYARHGAVLLPILFVLLTGVACTAYYVVYARKD